MKSLTKIGAILLFISFIISIPAIAEDLSEFSEIHSDVLEDYSTYAFKFTYLGAQKKIIPTNGGHGTERTFNIEDFKPYHREDSYRYDNDDIFVVSVITLSNQEFKAFVDAIGNHPELQSTADEQNFNASLMIIRDFDTETKCWEHIATRSETITLFNLLYNSVDPERQDIREIIRKCKGHMGGE